MTQQTLTRSFLKHSQPLLTKCLQAALIAAPVMLAAAPSHAAVTTTITGFTGQFDPTNWTTSLGGTSTNSVAFTPSLPSTPTTLTLFKSSTNSSVVSASRAIDQTLVDALRPNNGGVFKKYTVAGKYTFTGSNINNFNFVGDSNDRTATLTPTTTFTDFSFEGFGPLSAEGDDSVVFDIQRLVSQTGSNATGVINDFTFVAEYEEVPGPLPLVGAAAAFAWSRRLRKRLNSANTLA
jgi:hypothetical protein